ncbi:growth/differentiation factor 9 [Melanotaenia boesemani]|uniref:growth/differentiation factor 9 n=1 Tax=Melanotaenia boesemani TaxID=1250792 RepID=UPI001C05486E|nr:growth/differentiation factor 9 [Melanotaenia boesemani]
MEKQMLQSTTVHCFRALLLLLLVTCSSPPVRSSPAASNALHNLGGLTHPYSSIFSPLLKALSEHGETRWDPGLRKRIKPEHRYIKYLTDVYKKSPRSQRKVDGDRVYNTIRLIKPQDECLEQSDTESFTQDLSYNLEQIKGKEHLLKSALLYRFDSAHSAPINSVCYLSIHEREQSNQCQLCPGVYHAMNFTTKADRRRTWVEVDITSFLQPLTTFQKKNVHLLVNISCPEEQRTRSNGRRDLLEFSLRSPPLILYLNDTSKITHQRSPVSANEDQRPPNRFQRRGETRRWKRESPKSKGGHKNLDVKLPEILLNSEIPTSECALYDFRVKFSQLDLDHVIVHPPKYNPRYCRGICTTTMGYIYGSPRHAMVQSYIFENIDSSVPRPSCVPSHYRPLSVIISSKDGSLHMKDIEMVATRCTCR